MVRTSQWSAVILLMVACFLPEKLNAQTYLDAAQIKELFSGARVSGISPRTGNPRKAHFKKDGTYTGEVEGTGQVFYFDGKWWTEAPNKYCFRNRRREGCGRVRLESGNVYVIVYDEEGVEARVVFEK